MYQVRDSAFMSLIRQEVAWFDMRAPGTITSQLADDAAMLQAFVGQPIRSLTVSVSSVVVGLILSFVYMWYVDHQP
jgi:ABC-type multidrug transport system fused ATPase/permease subunit